MYEFFYKEKNYISVFLSICAYFILFMFTKFPPPLYLSRKKKIVIGDKEGCEAETVLQKPDRLQLGSSKNNLSFYHILKKYSFC